MVAEPRSPPPQVVPLGEVYVIRPWHNLVLLLLAVALHAPLLLEDWLSPTFPVHDKGAVVITGAGSGLGREAALLLSGERYEYTVYAAVRSNDQLRSLRSLGLPRLVPVLLDLGAKEAALDRSLADLRRTIEADGQPLVALVNNAAVVSHAPLECQDWKAAQEMMAVNVLGTLRVIQALLPLLRACQGRVVSMGSLSAVFTVPKTGAYAASKAALEAMSDALRRELLPLNVSVSIIEPALIASPMQDRAAASEQAVSEACASAYPHLYTATYRAQAERFASLASPASVVTSALLHALTSARPRTRYLVGNVDGWPASAHAWGAHTLPDRLLDHLILRVGR